MKGPERETLYLLSRCKVKYAYEPRLELISWGTLLYAKSIGNFGHKSNGKVVFVSFGPEHLGPPLEVVQFHRSDRDWALHFDKPSPYFTSVQYTYLGNAGNE